MFLGSGATPWYEHPPSHEPWPSRSDGASRLGCRLPGRSRLIDSEYQEIHLNNCPACELRVSGRQGLGWGTGLNCPRCGLVATLGPDVIAEHELKGRLGPMSDPTARHRRSRLSHILRRQQRPGIYVAINLNMLGSWRLEDLLPSAIEQMNSLILLVGDRQPSSGEWMEIPQDELAAWVGDAIAPDTPNPGLNWLIHQSEARETFEQRPGTGAGNWQLRLTLPGWHRYAELKRGLAESRIAFMAMQFGDAELNAIVDGCFRGAVARTGFELRLATDRQPAGLIDDQLRVALRTARFILADLTHGNRGAYWEAGFTEGLSKPVI